MKKLIAIGVVAVATLGLAMPAFAEDRPPTAAERTQLEQALQAAGFVSWEEVELDDDGPYWDVDDARTENGQRYDLKLNPVTMQIIERDLES